MKTLISPAGALKIAKAMETGDKVMLIPPHLIRRYKGQPREKIDPLKVDETAESIDAVGQKKDIIIKTISDDPLHPYELIDGEHRWLACMKINKPVRAVVKDGSKMTEEEQFKTSVVANFGGTEHTPMEIAHAIDRFMNFPEYRDLSVSKKMSEIAKIFVRSIGWVDQYRCLLKLDPEVQAMLSSDQDEDKTLTLLAAFCLTRLTPDLQKRIAKEAIAKRMSTNQIRFWARKMAREAGQSASTATRDRRPSDDFRIARNFVAKINESLTFFSDPLVLNQLKRCDAPALSLLAKDFTACAKRLGELAENLLSPAKKSVAVAAKVATRRSVASDSSPSAKPINGKIKPTVPRPAFSSSGTDDAQNSESEDLVEQYETENGIGADVAVADRDNRAAVRTLPKRRHIEADTVWMESGDTVKVFSDVLTVLGGSYERQKKDFSSKQIRTETGEENIYARYAEKNGKTGIPVNRTGFCYGPYIVFGKFFLENNVRSDEDYLKKWGRIKDPRIKSFYPADIKNYKKIFQKACFKLLSGKRLK